MLGDKWEAASHNSQNTFRPCSLPSGVIRDAQPFAFFPSSSSADSCLTQAPQFIIMTRSLKT
jgi:hypothetical protein